MAKISQKMQTREAIAAAVAVSKAVNIIVIYACEVRKLNASNDKSEMRILLLTNISVKFYTISNKPKLAREYYWVDLTNVNVENDTIELQFHHGDIRFQSYGNQSLQGKIGEIIQRILTPEEAEIVSVSVLTPKKYQQTLFGLYSRIISYAALFKFTISPIMLKTFKKIICNKRKECSFNNKTRSEFSTFFNGFNAASFIESIKFNVITSFDIFSMLCGYQKITKTHLEFHEIKVTNKFSAFLKEICTQKIKNNIKSITFTSMKFRDHDLSTIAQFCQEQQLFSLAINNSLIDKQVSFFVNNCLTPEVIPTLAMASLNNTLSLDIPLLLSKLKLLYSISLENCELDIDIVLQNVSYAQMPNLRMLNLSGNYATSISNQIVFPKKLDTIYVRNVHWGNLTLAPFMAIMSGIDWETEFSLSIRNIRAKVHEINSLFSFFGKVQNSNISCLDWAGNPISNEFINYLQKSSRLKELNVSNCFSTQNMALFPEFCHYCGESKLYTLIFVGNETSFLGPSINPLFNEIAGMQSLRYVNLSNQKFGNDGVNLFAEAVEANHKIEQVSFKGSEFDSLDVVANFCNKVKDRSKPIIIEWPSPDIKKIKNGTNVKKATINHLKTFIFKLANKNRSKEQSESSAKSQNSEQNSELSFDSNPMDKFHESYWFDIRFLYPSYLSSELYEKWFKGDHPQSPPPEEPQIPQMSQISPYRRVDTESSEEEQPSYSVSSKIRKSESKEEESRKSTPKKIIQTDSESSEEFNIPKKILKNSSVNSERSYSASKQKSFSRQILTDSDDSDDYIPMKRRKNSISTNESASNRSKRKRIVIPSDDDSEDNYPKSSRSSSKVMKSQRKSEWTFPISPPKNDKEMVDKIKEKFSFGNLMESLVNTRE